MDEAWGNWSAQAKALQQPNKAKGNGYKITVHVTTPYRPRIASLLIVELEKRH